MKVQLRRLNDNDNDTRIRRQDFNSLPILGFFFHDLSGIDTIISNNNIKYLATQFGRHLVSALTSIILILLIIVINNYENVVVVVVIITGVLHFQQLQQ